MRIDMRCRPPFGSFVKDKSLYSPTDGVPLGTQWYTQNVIQAPSPESALKMDMELLIKEMDEAGIDKIVAPVRAADGGDNAICAPYIEQYKNRVIGMAGIEPMDPVEKNLAIIDEFVINGPYTGVAIEPGFSPEPMHCNDERIYPVYAKCQENKIPVLLSFGGKCHKDLENFKPDHLDSLTKDFPDLTVILVHGGFPYVTEVCWLAMFRKNLYISPDCHLLSPGGRLYVDAAKYYLKDKIIFGTAYPIYPQKRMVEIYEEFFEGFPEDLFEKVMGDNAAKALGIVE